jgi:hypothetical protein
MACNHRPVPHRDSAGLGLVPVASILMQIAAAHARRLHFDHDIVGLGAGIGELHQLQLAVAVKHHPTHRFLPEFSLFPPNLGRKMRLRKGRTFDPFGETDDQGVLGEKPEVPPGLTS